MGKMRGLTGGTNEHPAVPGTPQTIGVLATRAEAQAAIVVLHNEHAEVVTRIGDGIHGNEQPFTLALRFVHATQLRTNLGRTDLETKGLSLGVDLRTLGSLLEAELFAGHCDQFKLNQHFRNRDLLEDLGRVRTDLISFFLCGDFQFLGRLVRTERHTCEQPANHRPRVLLAQKSLEGREPHGRIGTRELGKKIANRSGQFRSDQTEHVRHGQFLDGAFRTSLPAGF